MRGLARPRREDVTRGVDGECAPQEHRCPARRDVVVRGAELWDEREDVGREARRQFGDERFVAGAGLSDECANRDGELVSSRKLVGKDVPLLGRREVGPVRHGEDVGEPVGERGVERLRAEVERGVFAVQVVIRRRRVHRGPAVDEMREGAALDAALVDDGKELVLQFRARAADLVDEDDLGVPDALRRGEVVELRARGVRHRHAHEDAYCITLPFRPQGGGAARRS